VIQWAGQYARMLLFLTLAFPLFLFWCAKVGLRKFRAWCWFMSRWLPHHQWVEDLLIAVGLVLLGFAVWLGMKGNV